MSEEEIDRKTRDQQDKRDFYKNKNDDGGQMLKGRSGLKLIKYKR
jgi:hypothetical protein